MRRRIFIIAFGSAAAAMPLGVGAQQSAMPVIGYLGSTSAGSQAAALQAFHQGLGQSGYVEGQNVRIKYRWANGRYDQLPRLAAELVARQPAVIVAVSDPAALAAKAATRTIPIVFNTGSDPELLGLISTLNRPGGNLTGVSQLNNELAAKRLELLHELVPMARSIGYLVNPDNPNVAASEAEVHKAARALGLDLVVAHMGAGQDFETIIAALAGKGIAAMLIASDPVLLSRRSALVSAVAAHRLPAFYTIREYTSAGGLISYSANQTHLYRQTGHYAGSILKGAQPADLPVQQPMRFELVINLKTAKALGLDVPMSVLVRADEVIE